MPLLLIVALIVLAGCSPAPAPVAPQKPKVTEERWYGQLVERLTKLNRDAETLFREGKQNRAAEVIKEAEPLAAKLLAAPEPTLAAMEAASDLDDLYGRMLLANRNYGWARMMFQKNQARWKHWEPQTPEVVDRRKKAEAAIAECDRRMVQ